MIAVHGEPTEHPLLGHFRHAAEGHFPPADGGFTMLPPVANGKSAVVAFTGHAFIATDLALADIDHLPIDGFGAAHGPELLLRLARGGRIDVVDATLVARGRGGGSLPLSTQLDDHPRVRYARSLRAGVEVFGDERGFVTLACGLAGRREMSVEIPDAARGTGIGRALIEEALDLVPAGELLFAAVSPGNTRSLRAFLAVGFTPIGSEVIITPPANVLS